MNVQFFIQAVKTFRVHETEEHIYVCSKTLDVFFSRYRLFLRADPEVYIYYSNYRIKRASLLLLFGELSLYQYSGINVYLHWKHESKT